ncbi:TonB-dependent receptor [Marinilabiliaceae bacterium JC017]|nr:TonB-dependent receptor [Marinilabiliaceae bacterium JC017]
MKYYLIFLSLFIWGEVVLHAQKNQFTISGYVSDVETGEKLLNANVYEAENLTGTISNTYGFYSLTLPKGKHTVVFSYVGYKTIQKEIDLQADLTLNVDLAPNGKLEEVTVVGKARESKLTDTQMSTEVVSMETVKNLPSFMGEADVMKTLQLLPGVQSGSESSSGLYVRGGGPDQNLILLDGTPVYNANHLFGFFSVFNADAIKNVTLYKGGFPARFGGRLSSVVDIKMKEGNEKEFHGGMQVGLIASKFFVEGPIKEDKTAFHISGRRTYIDLLARPFMHNEETGGYFFYDLNAKVNHKFSDKSRLYISAYTGRDKAYSEYDETDSWDGKNNTYKDKSKLYWGNLTTALRWNYIFTNKLFSNTTVTYSQYQFRVNSTQETLEHKQTTEDTYYNYKSGINDVSYKIDFDWYPTPAHDVKFGANYTYHTFKPGVEVLKANNIEEQPVNTVFGDQDIYAHEVTGYIEDNMKITSRLKANVGLHVSGFNVENTFYSSFEPRASLRYLATDKLTFKMAYARMQQYIHLLSNSTIGLPTDLWVPVTKKIKPMVSHQMALGTVYSPRKGYSISLEGYYKEMDNLIEYKEGASFFGSSQGWEEKVEMGEGRSYGAELLLKKETGKTTGWIGYTLSKTDRKFDNINFGKYFPARYDRRHDVSVAVTHKFSDKIDLGISWVYGTGNAITLPSNTIATLEINHSDYGSYEGNTVQYFDQRNNYRMPDYHRLDVGINFHKVKKHGVRTWNISVYNAYNRKNPFFLYVGEKDDVKVLKQVSLFPILPSVSYTYKF